MSSSANNNGTPVDGPEMVVTVQGHYHVMVKALQRKPETMEAFQAPLGWVLHSITPLPSSSIVNAPQLVLLCFARVQQIQVPAAVQRAADAASMNLSAPVPPVAS